MRRFRLVLIAFVATACLPTFASAASLTLKTRVTVVDTQPAVTSAAVVCELFDAPGGAAIATPSAGSSNRAAAGIVGRGVARNLSLPLNNQEVRVRITVPSVAELARARAYACSLYLVDGSGAHRPIAASASAAAGDAAFHAAPGKPFTPEVSGNF